MRHYLINGYLEFTGKPFRCILGGRAILEDHEVMDHATLRKVEALLLTEQLELRDAGKGVAAWAEPCGFKVTSFQPFEAPATIQPVPAPAVHLNPADFAALPPVDSPLLIEIAPGVLVLASRPAHAKQKGDVLRFDLPSGGHVVGRFRWTHA